MTSERLESMTLGMLLFVVSEVMFFGGLFAAYFTLKDLTQPWPPAALELELLIPAVITVLLITSSATAHKAEAAAADGDLKEMRRWIWITLTLAAVFLGGQALEYSELGFSISDGSFASLFFTMTGFHGAHVAGGMVMLTAATVTTTRSEGRSGRGHLRGAVMYWHFVDVVWVGLFVTLYIVR
jgi:cytochrome c oxidase subunit III